MKVLNWIAWISAGIGILLISFAGLSSLLPRVCTQTNCFGFAQKVNFFIASSSFFLITIALFVFEIKNQLNKDKSSLNR
jgi:hypothetical protein